MQTDRIYKINKMGRKKINPVNLVNPVYFLRRDSRMSSLSLTGAILLGRLSAPLYAKYGKAEGRRIELFECGHEELPEMRRLTPEWTHRRQVDA